MCIRSLTRSHLTVTCSISSLPYLAGLSLCTHVPALPGSYEAALSAALTFCLSLWQEELEHLNQASEEINQVELQLDVSDAPFPHTLEG